MRSVLGRLPLFVCSYPWKQQYAEFWVIIFLVIIGCFSWNNYLNKKTFIIFLKWDDENEAIDNRMNNFPVCDWCLKPSMHMTWVFYGQFQVKNKQKGERVLRIWSFKGYRWTSMWNFQWLIKNEVEFQKVTKKIKCGISRVFVFGLGILKGSNTILWKFQG